MFFFLTLSFVLVNVMAEIPQGKSVQLSHCQVLQRIGRWNYTSASCYLLCYMEGTSLILGPVKLLLGTVKRCVALPHSLKPLKSLPCVFCPHIHCGIVLASNWFVFQCSIIFPLKFVLNQHTNGFTLESSQVY